jgi:hypothetical protein
VPPYGRAIAGRAVGDRRNNVWRQKSERHQEADMTPGEIFGSSDSFE